MLNLAFASNLRATLLHRNTERPIDTLQDAFKRGENIWTYHLVPDENYPDYIQQLLLDWRLDPDIRGYMEMKGNITTYDLRHNLESAEGIGFRWVTKK